jgi:hypothetical protein
MAIARLADFPPLTRPPTIAIPIPEEWEKEGQYKIIYDPDRPQAVYPRSDYDLWESGWPFPVP